MIVFLKFILLFAASVCSISFLKVDSKVTKILDKHPLAELKVDTAANVGTVIFSPKHSDVNVKKLIAEKKEIKHRRSPVKKQKEEPRLNTISNSVAIQPESILVPDPDKKDSVLPPVIKLNSKIVVKKAN